MSDQHLLDHDFVIRVADHAEQPSFPGGFSVSAGFSQHENVFNVVFDHSIRFIGLSEKTTVTFNFVGCIGDFMPDYRREIGKPDPTAAFLYGCMEGHAGMLSTVSAPRQADITDNAHHPPSGNQGIEHYLPDTVERFKKLLVIFDMAKLAFNGIIRLESPVGRGGDNQMNGTSGQKIDESRIRQY